MHEWNIQRIIIEFCVLCDFDDIRCFVKFGQYEFRRESYRAAEHNFNCIPLERDLIKFIFGFVRIDLIIYRWYFQAIDFFLNPVASEKKCHSINGKNSEQKPTRFGQFDFRWFSRSLYYSLRSPQSMCIVRNSLTRVIVYATQARVECPDIFVFIVSLSQEAACRKFWIFSPSNHFILRWSWVTEPICVSLFIRRVLARNWNQPKIMVVATITMKWVFFPRADSYQDSNSAHVDLRTSLSEICFIFNLVIASKSFYFSLYTSTRATHVA